MSKLFKSDDKIILNDMEFFGYHGVYDSEKATGQKFEVSVTIYADLSLAQLTDNVEYTVNYADVYDIIKGIVAKERYDLIEALAGRIAQAILDIYVQAEKVRVFVRKPEAPIEGYTTGGPAVEIERKRSEKETAYIALGSNLGDSKETLAAAVKMLDDACGIEVKKVSSLYRTKPVGYLDQPDFINGAIKIQTTLKPHELLDVTRRIEYELGRVRTIKNGARTIDLDILLYGQQKILTENLIVPHERMFGRAFVLVPLCDVIDEEAVAWMQLNELAKKCDDFADLQLFEAGVAWYKGKDKSDKQKHK